ncbi:MAG: hypothetical protein RR585_04210 [Coprobacillus sp.]
MIAPGYGITLRPYKFYKNDPSKNVIVGYGEDKRGSFLKFQVMDFNANGTEKGNTGFTYVNIYTDLALKVGDMVRVDKILYAQFKRQGNCIGITIKETNPSGCVIEEEQDCLIMEDIDF